MLTRFQSVFFVTFAGICAGIFAYVRSIPVIRFSPESRADSTIIWAYAPLSRLGFFVLAAVVLLVCFWLVYAFIYARRFNTSFASSLRLDAYTYLPLCVLALAFAQFNSFLTYHFEGVLLLSSGVGDVLVAVALLAVVYLKMRNLRHSADSRIYQRNEAAAAPTWKIQAAVFVISLAIYGFVGFRVTQELTPGGDEPHYLLITHSLLHDHDLAIINNYKQRDYQAFFQGELKPHVSIGRHGVRYPGHPIGLPMLLLPAYALNGYRGAVVLMNILSAALAWQIFLLACSLTTRRWLAWLLWGAASFTSPLLIYSSQIYPEIPSALLLILAYRSIAFPPPCRHETMIAGKPTVKNAVVLGVTLALLPWIQQRMILPALLLLLAHVAIVYSDYWRNGRRKDAFLSAAIPSGCLVWSGLLLAGFYYLLYKNPLPNAPYTSVGITKVFSLEILLKEGLFGLLLDQEAGLLMFSPFYLFAFAGLLMLFRRRTLYAAFLLTLILSVYLPCGGFTLQWRGAWSPASRYMVVLAPFFLIPVGVSLHAITRPAYRYIFIFLAGIGAYWSVLFLQSPFAAIMKNGGVNSTLLQQSDLLDLTRFFPMFGQASPGSVLVVGFWIAVIVIFSICAYRSQWFDECDPAYRVPTEQTAAQHVRAVFGFYGALIAGFLTLTFAVTHVPPKTDYAQTSNKNQQVRAFLTHFSNEAFAANRIMQQPPEFSGKDLRFEYLRRAKRGSVNQAGPRFIVTGPREPFPKGRYTAYFEMRVEQNSTKAIVVILDVVARRGEQIFARKELRGADFAAAGSSESVALAFELSEPVEDLETRVFFSNVENLTVSQIYIEPDVAEFYYSTGVSALQAEQYGDATALFGRVALHTDVANRAQYQLAVIAQHSGNWVESLDILQTVIAQEPAFADAHYRLGLALNADGQSESALQAFERAAQALPTHLDAWQALQETAPQLGKETLTAHQAIQQLYHPQYPYTVNFGNQLQFLGYSASPSAPGKIKLEYYWKATADMQVNYAFFVHFTGTGADFQQDHFPQIPDKATGSLIPYPTSQWKIGELVREEFEISAPVGAFDIEIGAWEPVHTQQKLQIISPDRHFQFWNKSKLALKPLIIQ